MGTEEGENVRTKRDPQHSPTRGGSAGPKHPVRVDITVRIGAILITAIGPVLCACSLRDAMTTDVEVVARAAEHELTVDELAGMVAQSNIPLTRSAIEGSAQLWIDYALFAQRLASGDSLVDTSTVANAMWYHVDSLLVGRFRLLLMDSLVQIDDAFIDSAYAAGEHRLFDLIIVQVADGVTVVERERRRLAATRLRARVAAGTPWERVVGDLDPAAGAQGGRMLVTRDALPPGLADTVFKLAPGALSGVVEAPSAFYVVRRTRLADSRADFVRALRDTLIGRIEVEYFEALPEKWSIAVRSRAPALVREAARYPHQAASSEKILGTFRTGEFTVADFVRWLPVLPIQGQIARAADEQLTELVRSIMQSEILFLEAQQRGIVLRREEFAQLKDRLAEQITQVRDSLGLDVLLMSSTAPEVLRRMVQLAVARHLSEVLGGQRRLVVVPPSLAEILRRDSQWNVSHAAVDRAVERARTLRLEMAQAGAVLRPPLPVSARPPSEESNNAR